MSIHLRRSSDGLTAGKRFSGYRLALLLTCAIAAQMALPPQANAAPPDVVASITPDGDTISISTGEDQNARVTFNAPTEGQRYILYWTPHYPDSGGGFPVAGMIFVPDCGWSCVQDFGPAGDPRHVEFTVSEAGAKTISIDPEEFATGSMELRLVSIPADVVAPIVVDGATITIETVKRGQNARVTFNAPTEGQRYILYWTPHYPDSGGGFPVAGMIFVPYCGWSCVQDFGPAGDPRHVEFTVSEAGAKTISIDPEEFATGSMELRLVSVPADVVKQIMPDGDPVHIETVKRGQNAQLTFDAPSAGQRYILYWTPHYPDSGGGFPVAGMIFVPDCGWSCVQDFGPAGDPRHVEFTVSEAGAKTISIDPEEFGTGCIDLVLRLAHPDPGHIPIPPIIPEMGCSVQPRTPEFELVHDFSLVPPNPGQHNTLCWDLRRRTYVCREVRGVEELGHNQSYEIPHDQVHKVGPFSAYYGQWVKKDKSSIIYEGCYKPPSNNNYYCDYKGVGTSIYRANRDRRYWLPVLREWSKYTAKYVAICTVTVMSAWGPSDGSGQPLADIWEACSKEPFQPG